MNQSKLVIHLFAVIMLAFGLFASGAKAATFTVSNTEDSGAGSLRQAVMEANASDDTDQIVFDPTVFAMAQTINLTSGELAIRSSVVISGTGARLLTIQRSAAAPTNFRIFIITGGRVNISGITIAGGNIAGGGGVLNVGVTLTMDAVAVSGNTSSNNSGGGIYNGGTTTIVNSTISGNSATNFGGGIYNGFGSTINIANSTISGNIAAGSGGIDNSGTLNMNNVTVTNNSTTVRNTDNTGGVYNSGVAVNLRNTIIAGNTAVDNQTPDVSGTFVSNGNNLIGNTTGSTGFSAAGSDKLDVAPILGALANNGGQTDTHALLAGSPAIDKGNNQDAPATDQRGFARIVGGAVDIGAYEFATVKSRKRVRFF